MDNEPLFTLLGIPFHLDAWLRSVATAGVILIGLGALAMVRRKRGH